MYFSPLNGPVPVNGSLIASIIPGQRIKGISPSQSDTYVLGACVPVQLFNIAAVGAGVVSTTLEQTFVLPTRCKIPKINVSFTAIDSLAGTDLLNIVQGTSAAYTVGNVAGNDNSSTSGFCTNPAVDGDALFNIDVPITVANFPNAHTSAVAATGYFTLSGIPTTGFNNVYGFGSLGTVVVAQATGNTLAVQATADAAAITAAAIGITASSSGNQVIPTATTAGSQGNFITTSASTTGGDSIFTGQLLLSGGINTGGSSGLGLIPTYPDAVYPCGATLTLRLITTAATGSITNLSVSAVLIPQPLEATFPSQVIESASASPYGGPYGGYESFQVPSVPVAGRDF
jgi:hypothetical protein